MIIKKINSLLSACFILASTGCINSQSQVPVKKSAIIEPTMLKRVVVNYNDTVIMHFVNNAALFNEGWDTLGQAKFWKQIIHLNPDSSIINVAQTRQTIETISAQKWMQQTEDEKTLAKAWVCQMNNLDSGTCLYVSIGRKDFFEHRKSLATIDKAIKVFEQNQVDPWYAQTILLIESPGKNAQRSWAGAIGPFQLMPDVARRYGLRVTKTVDERKSIERSAYGASQLLGRSFIPQVRQMLDKRNIAYNETDTWFRLLVLHTYHAGPGNVEAVLNVIQPTQGNMNLIRSMWNTEARGFKNESQNYSQIALGCLLNFSDIIGNSDTLYTIHGDVAYKKVKQLKPQAAEAVIKYTQCMLEYENDLVEGVIPFGYFMDRINTLKNEMAASKLQARQDQNPVAILYPVDETHYLSISKMLLRKRDIENAKQLLNYNAGLFPDSKAATDSLLAVIQKPPVKANPAKKKSGSHGSKIRSKR
ncbi:MAG: transglycosylase SLT domain-containing protein [Bacteroidia bacterium]|nr:transglycosylase SLT domain-containing protein [Bacteroidia bacterium]